MKIYQIWSSDGRLQDTADESGAPELFGAHERSTVVAYAKLVASACVNHEQSARANHYKPTTGNVTCDVFVHELDLPSHGKITLELLLRALNGRGWSRKLVEHFSIEISESGRVQWQTRKIHKVTG